MVAVAALVLVEGVRTFIRARTTQSMNACVNNLRQIESAKEQWALENKITNGTPTLEDLRPYMGRGTGGTMAACPRGGIYTPGRVGEPPKCSTGGSHTLE